MIESSLIIALFALLAVRYTRTEYERLGGYKDGTQERRRLRAKGRSLWPL